ncbi:hypothetical protein SSX86_029398 [Deinandra increscens subsp. villosa]|uniref:MYB transcription factor n=1 Tax=Deinandra increscens subsp. villosa TaxID=3103831 RepID=A0AAP0GK32_9ASTR
MAKPKQKWTSEEEKALSAGVEKYGLGKWKSILTDPQFASSLANRSNVDLKDKWRNLSGNDYVPSSRRNVRTSWMQVMNNLLLTYPEPSTSRLLVERRRPPPYKTMIYEALSSIDDPNGTHVNTMVQFLEPKYELPKNFRRLLSAKLRKLVLNGDLEKVDHRYKVKVTSSAAETSQQEDVWTDNDDNHTEEQVGPQNLIEAPLGLQNHNEGQVEPYNLSEEQVEPLPTETLEDAASVSAYQVALAVYMEDQLKKTCADRDKLSDLLQESEAMVLIAEELYELCLKDGSVILSP